ncbi:MAG: hypothetical protein KDB86_04115 [Actinobacteria bacterium]|nr:hypothetical protein [Actinomycetota bacterium]
MFPSPRMVAAVALTPLLIVACSSSEDPAEASSSSAAQTTVVAETTAPDSAANSNAAESPNERTPADLQAALGSMGVEITTEEAETYGPMTVAELKRFWTEQGLSLPRSLADFQPETAVIGQMSADQLKMLYGLDRSDDEGGQRYRSEGADDAIAAVREQFGDRIGLLATEPDGGMTVSIRSLTDADREATADVEQSTGVQLNAVDLFGLTEIELDDLRTQLETFVVGQEPANWGVGIYAGDDFEGPTDAARVVVTLSPDDLSLAKPVREHTQEFLDALATSDPAAGTLTVDDAIVIWQGVSSDDAG